MNCISKKEKICTQFVSAWITVLPRLLSILFFCLYWQYWQFNSNDCCNQLHFVTSLLPHVVKRQAIGTFGIPLACHSQILLHCLWLGLLPCVCIVKSKCQRPVQNVHIPSDTTAFFFAPPAEEWHFASTFNVFASAHSSHIAWAMFFCPLPNQIVYMKLNSFLSYHIKTTALSGNVTMLPKSQMRKCGLSWVQWLTWSLSHMRNRSPNHCSGCWQSAQWVTWMIHSAATSTKKN